MARKEKEVSNRRNFLKLASIGTLAGGVAAVSGTSAKASEETKNHGSGYRESDHVKKVYELSRF